MCDSKLSDRLLFENAQGKGFTQEDFSRKLMMDTRSYAALEHGENLCCTLTFILFLCFHCKNPEKLIRDMKSILQEFQNRPIS